MAAVAVQAEEKNLPKTTNGNGGQNNDVKPGKVVR